MKKKFVPYLICWTIFLALFHVIVFVTPNEIAGMSKFGGGFWIGYGFTLAAFLGQLLCVWLAFKEGEKRKLFYKLPLVYISYITLILTAAVGIVFMTVPQIPAWIAAIVCAVITAFGAVAVITAKAAAETVSAIDEKIKTRTAFIKELTARAESVMTQAQTPELKTEAKKVYEAIRYSDPISGAELSEIEGKISEAFVAFAKNVSSCDTAETKSSSANLILLLNERATKCKLLK